MTTIRLGVRCQRKALVFVIGLARIPLLLFRYRCGVRADKGKSVESIAEYVTIHFSRLRLVDDLPCFLEALQGKRVVGWSALRREHLGQMSDAQQFPHARCHVGEFKDA